MKYLIEWWPKEPFEANMKKVLEIETERNKKKVAITESVFPIHYSLSRAREPTRMHMFLRDQP